MEETAVAAAKRSARYGSEARARTAWFAFAFGLLFAAASLSPGYVGGNGPYWQAPSGDAAAGQIGWFYFARDAWHFPLLATNTYHAPEGANLMLADSLPLFGLPAKLLYKMVSTPDAAPPIYIGLWVALCFVLQAVAASRLLRALGVIRAVPHVAGLVLFCYAPILFLRFGHATLMGQFLILFALEGYVRAKRAAPTPGGWIALCALPVVALLIHPYLVAMSGALVAATIVDQWREGALRWRGVLLRFGGMAVAAAVLVKVCGVPTGGMDFGDYGFYSLNLLSPWVPFPNTASGRWLGTQIPSITGLYQWEGGAYLGAGVLLLGVCALPALRDWRANVRRHAVLLTVLVGLLIFAVSHRVGFGSRELFQLPLPDALLHAFSQMRGSGRFVWVAVYALLAALVAAVANRYGARAPLLLACAAVLQFVDVRPMQAGVRAATASPAATTIDRAAWSRLLAEHTQVFEFPSFECGGLFGAEIPGGKFRALEIDWIAAQQNKPVNSAYLARFSKDCAREREDATANLQRPGLLRLYRSSEDIGAFLAEHGLDATRCGYLDDVVVCSAGRDLSALK
jgi:hypothetical protein